MDKLLICIGVAFFIILPLILICFHINPSWPEPGEFDIKDPWTGEIID